MISVKSLIRRFLRDEQGASLVEYGLLVGLIAVVAVLAVAAVGTDVFNAFDVTQQQMDATTMVPLPPN